MIETTVADVAVTILLVKLEKLLSVERFVFPGLRNSVVIGINELREILSFIVAENSSNIDLKSQLLPAVYFAEDFTENFLLSAAKKRQKGIFKILPTPLKPFPSCRQLQLSYKMLKFVKKLKDLSCEISKNTRHPITEVGGGHSCQYDQQQNLALVVHEDAEKELVARLINDDNDNNSLRVISLVSKEALGKTALARKVYNRLDIRQHFQCRAWLDVPKDFKLKDVLLIILKHIPICVLKDVELMSEKELSAMLFQLLMDVRFLIVLDDVCTVDIWLDLAYSFPDAANGSRVILTTHDSDVASCADPWSPLLKLERLTDDRSWGLFLKKLGRSCENTNLREEILKICDGLPPAILLLGGVLSNMESSEWSKVIDPAVAHFGGGGQSQSSSPLLNNIVALSYQNLPYLLKPCFLYLVLFPKGYEIPTRRLLKLWVAEGFVQISPNASSVDVSEDVAKTYLEELVCRNMIEIASWKSDGTPKSCRMPCYLYDVFLPKSKEIGFLHVHHHESDCTSAVSPEFNIRRLADQFVVKSTSESHIGHLCSYVSFDTQKQDTSSREIGMLLLTIINNRSFVMLKVLDLEGVYKPLLPEKLGVLQNLKYIGLRWTGLDSCPKSIGKLPCLETLDLKYTNITTLPSPIWKAKTLRHLNMNEVSIQKPSKDCSTNLHTLMGLLIGSKDPKIYGLDRCTSLRKLGLTCHSKSVKETAECISRLDNLQTLRLRSRDPFGQPLDLELSPMKDHQSLSNLYLFGVIKDGISNLPRNLKILTLSMSKLEKDPMLELGELPQLNTLRLFARSYVGSEMACLHGHFLQLRVLKLWKLENLEQWTVKEGSMPQLQELEIRDCEKLKSSDGLSQLPALKEFIFTNMAKDFVEDFRRLGRDILLTNKWEPSAVHVSFPQQYIQ